MLLIPEEINPTSENYGLALHSFRGDKMFPRYLVPAERTKGEMYSYYPHLISAELVAHKF